MSEGFEYNFELGVIYNGRLNMLH